MFENIVEKIYVYQEQSIKKIAHTVQYEELNLGKKYSKLKIKTPVTLINSIGIVLVTILLKVVIRLPQFGSQSHPCQFNVSKFTHCETIVS